MRYEMTGLEHSIVRPDLPANSHGVPRVDGRRVPTGFAETAYHRRLQVHVLERLAPRIGAHRALICETASLKLSCAWAARSDPIAMTLS